MVVRWRRAVERFGRTSRVSNQHQHESINRQMMTHSHTGLPPSSGLVKCNNNKRNCFKAFNAFPRRWAAGAWRRERIYYCSHFKTTMEKELQYSSMRGCMKLHITASVRHCDWRLEVVASHPQQYRTLVSIGGPGCAGPGSSGCVAWSHAVVVCLAPPMVVTSRNPRGAAAFILAKKTWPRKQPLCMSLTADVVRHRSSLVAREPLDVRSPFRDVFRALCPPAQSSSRDDALAPLILAIESS